MTTGAHTSKAADAPPNVHERGGHDDFCERIDKFQLIYEVEQKAILAEARLLSKVSHCHRAV
jgi:hypothetical protein